MSHEVVSTPALAPVEGQATALATALASAASTVLAPAPPPAPAAQTPAPAPPPAPAVQTVPATTPPPALAAQTTPPPALPLFLPGSNCYKDPWMDEMVRSDPDGNGKVFIDVGCNTGSDAVMFLERWGKAGVAKIWDDGLKTYGVPAGACGQNEFRGVGKVSSLSLNKLSDASAGGPKVLCVEPMPSTARMLQNLTASFFGKSGSFEVVQAAVSDQITNQTVLFPNARAGAEDAGIAHSSSQGGELVPVAQVTVDQLMEQRGFKTVDVLTIDTEGHDPSVIKGAETTLKYGKVRLLVFEVHQDLANTAWATTPLIAVLQKLDSWQYDCYLPDNGGKVHRLTGVWNEEMESKYRPMGWSNVACVKKKDPWHAVMEKFNAPM